MEELNELDQLVMGRKFQKYFFIFEGFPVIIWSKIHLFHMCYTIKVYKFAQGK